MIEEPPVLKIRRATRRPSAEQIAAFQGVPTGFVVDALGGAGALSGRIGPIGAGRDVACIAAGPAVTADCGPADVMATFAALASLQKGDVLVAASGGYDGAAGFGDRLVGMMRNCGAAGFVTDAPGRDYVGVVAVGLPVWCAGLTPATPFSKGPGSVGYPVQIGGQSVSSGDMVVGDLDGVVVVPFERVDEVIERLGAITEMEARLDAEVAAGRRMPQWVEEMLAGDEVAWED